MKAVGAFFAAAIWVITAYIYLVSGVLVGSLTVLPGYVHLFLSDGSTAGIFGLMWNVAAPLVPLLVGMLLTSMIFGALGVDRGGVFALYMASMISVFVYYMRSYILCVRLDGVDLGSVAFGLFGLMFLMFVPLVVLTFFQAIVNVVMRRTDFDANAAAIGVTGAAYMLIMLVAGSVYLVRDFYGGLLVRSIGTLLVVGMLAQIMAVFAIIALLPSIAITYFNRRIFPEHVSLI
ncbi:MAG: hypothetical protein FWD96_06185 [Defluviitaleaceae bacterium]|nr:hypothetical protein [Defluviitaleaceae bacterium]